MWLIYKFNGDSIKTGKELDYLFEIACLNFQVVSLEEWLSGKENVSENIEKESIDMIPSFIN